MGSLTGSLEGTNVGIPKGAFLGFQIEYPRIWALLVEPF